MASSCTLFMIVTLIVLSALVAATSAYHTTTVEIVNPGESQRCSQKVGSEQVRSCQQYLKTGSQFDAGRDEGGWREAFPKCCDELEKINEDECRCEAIKQVTEEQRRQGGKMQAREIREMLLTAKSLPSLCRISPQYCQNIPGGSMF